MPTTSLISGLRKDFVDGGIDFGNVDVTATVNVIDAQILRVDAIDDFAKNPATTTASVVGFRGGTVRAADGTVTKKAAFTYTPPTAVSGTLTTYVEINSAGVVSGNAVAFSADKKPLAIVIANTTNITSVDDTVRVGFDFGGTNNNNSVSDASTTVKGVSKLSVAPVDTANPIVLAVNDPIVAQVATNTAAITTEVTNRTAADTTLQNNINTHASASKPHAGHLNTDGTNTMSGALGMGNNKITNVAAGVASNDVATVGQLAAATTGYSDKLKVKAATTGNITLSGVQSTDTVSCATNDRVLVHLQTTQSQNGIYLFNSSGAWTRATDADTAAELPAGSRVFIENGTLYGNKYAYMVSTLTTVGTDAMAWEIREGFSGGTTTTSSNVGTGASVFKGLAGTVNEFRSILPLSNKLTATANGDNVEVDIVEANLSLANIGGTLPVTKGGTGLTSTVTGDLIIAAAANTLARLAGNTTTTRKFLSSTGVGGNATAPEYNSIRGEDVPVFTSTTPGVLPASGAVVDPDAVPHADGTWRKPFASAGSITTSQSAALAGVGSAPSATNKYVTESFLLTQKGINARYYTGSGGAIEANFQVERIEPSIDFHAAANNSAANRSSDPLWARADFSVLLKGDFVAPFSETFTFEFVRDDSVTVTIDGIALVFTDIGNNTATATKALVQGQKYRIVADFRNGPYEAARLEGRWSSASQVKQIIPTTAITALSAESSGVSSWNDLADKPATFPPSVHSQAASTITGLATVATSGSYNDLSDKPTGGSSIAIPAVSASINVAPGKPVTGSNFSNLTNINDGNTSTVTSSTNQWASEGYIDFDFGSGNTAVQVSGSLMVQFGPGAGLSGKVFGFNTIPGTVQGGTQLFSGVLGALNDTYTAFNFTNTAAYRYIRFYFAAGAGSNGTAIIEIRLFTAADTGTNGAVTGVDKYNLDSIRLPVTGTVSGVPKVAAILNSSGIPVGFIQVYPNSSL